ncbi:MAG: flagellar M-ring protein FliF [Oscillospiraceae bacterium]|jgi:flagellar M-ring protein FliF|nr:flagellar M-ring protein FliF [Oscillospiraceae bacterium]
MEKAKETGKKLFEFLKAKWDAMTKTARIITLGVSAAVVVALILVIALTNNTNYTVLYTNVSNDEMSEITAALSGMGITDVKIDSQTISVPREQADRARMDLAIQGFPKSGFNYDIWNDGVNMFSTDSDRRVLQKQQLEFNTRAALMVNPDVINAVVQITLPHERPFVINPEQGDSQASVILTLRPGVRFTTEQIQGMQWLVLKSVPQLKLENLSILNSDYMEFIPEDADTSYTDLALEIQRLTMQRNFENEYREMLTQLVSNLLEGTTRNHRVAVNVKLDFSNWSQQETIYTGSNVDENGHQSGIIDIEELRVGWNRIGMEGGVVGTATNADIPADYPTWTGDAEVEGVYERMEMTHYMVNESIRIVESNGVEVKNISAAVQIDEGSLPQDEIDRWVALVANAIGADFENVSVNSIVFPLETPTQPIPVPVPSPVRNVLVFIIISLGALLIILFMLAIMSSGSKKRRLIRARSASPQFAGAAPGYAGSGDEDFGAYAMQRQQEEDDKIEIQSLLETDGAETRDTLLKNEIREFAKTNPDIVAQLIRTWIREG